MKSILKKQKKLPSLIFALEEVSQNDQSNPHPTEPWHRLPVPDGPGAGSAQKARQDAELDGSFVSPKDGDTSNKDGGCLVGSLTVKITANPLDDQKMLVTCFGLKFHSFGVWGFGEVHFLQ